MEVWKTRPALIVTSDVMGDGGVTTDAQWASVGGGRRESGRVLIILSLCPGHGAHSGDQSLGPALTDCQ